MGATPDRPRPKPTFSYHIQISIKTERTQVLI